MAWACRAWWATSTIKYFLRYLVSHTLAPFAWYRIALAAVTAVLAALGAGLIVVQWLRRRFVTGFVVTVPLVISLVSLVWVFRAVDGLVGPIYHRWLPFAVPGLGIVTTVVLILAVGTVATNVFGKRLLQRAEGYLMMVPVFRTIYSPVKQIVAAFSPDNKYGFRKVALVEDPAPRARCSGS